MVDMSTAHLLSLASLSPLFFSSNRATPSSVAQAPLSSAVARASRPRMSSLAIRRVCSMPLEPALPQPPQCPPSRAARKRSFSLLLALASPRCSKPRPGLSPDAFRAWISWARLSDRPDIARLMPHICHVAAACARGRGSGAIIAEPSQRSLSRER